jgi:hypothetical protein
MTSGKTSQKTSNKKKIDIEWENRILCSDGNCIGVIGTDGRCKVCGRPHEDGLKPDQDLTEISDDDTFRDEITDDSDDSDAKEPPADSNEAEKHPAENRSESADDDWSNRRLCSDGNCIGVIGPDGRCKVCHKEYEE